MRFHANALHFETDFEALRADWQALFDRVEGAAWSCAPEVYHCWRKTLRTSAQDRIIEIRDDDGALRGIFPASFDRAWRGPAVLPRFDYDPQDKAFVQSKRLRPIPVRQVTGMASLPATMLWLAPLCQPEDRIGVMTALGVHLQHLGGWNVAVFPAYEGDEQRDMQEGLAAADMVAHKQTLGREVQNLVALAPFDDVISGQPQKFRQNVRRARRVFDDTGLDITFHAGKDAFHKVAPAIMDLAQKSWKHEGRAGTAVHIPYAGAQQTFFETLLVSDRLGGTPSVGLVTGPNGPIAALMMLHMQQTVTALLTFWDGQYDKASPGLLLLGASMDWAVAQGATRFDMNSTAPWVRYLVDSTNVVCNLAVFRKSLVGQSLRAIARARGAFE